LLIGALKAVLGARGPNAAPCFLAMLVDEPTTTLAALQAHRSLNRAAKRFLRLDLIHSPDIKADDEKNHGGGVQLGAADWCEISAALIIAAARRGCVEGERVMRIDQPL
jgi:hypothetical protein